MDPNRSQICSFLISALNELERGDATRAIEEVEKALAIDKALPEGIHILGLVAVRLDEQIKAVELFTAAHDLAPDRHEHAEALSIVNARLGRLKESLYFGKLSTALQPYEDLPGLLPEWLGTFEESFSRMRESPYLDQGLTHFRQGQFNKAITQLHKAAELDAQNPVIWRHLIQALRRCNRPYEALMVAKGLDDLNLDEPSDLSLSARAMADIGRFEEAVDCHTNVIEAAPEDPSLRSALLRDLERQIPVDMDALAAAERGWGASFAEPAFVYDWMALAAGTPTKLKVGFVSGRFRAGSGLDHLWPLLMYHGQPSMSVHCYSHNDFDDVISRRIAGAVESWTDVSEVDDRTAAEIIHNDGIDILIDLDGHRETGHPLVFGYQPAPVSLRYLGLPDAAVAQGLDGALAGGFCLPAGLANAAVVDGGMASLAPDLRPQGRSGGDAETIRIGCAPYHHEITPEFYLFWAKILNACDNLTLVLYTGRLGGVTALDAIDPQLEANAIFDRVVLSEPHPDAHSAQGEFLDGIDFLVVPTNSDTVDVAYDALGRGLPVLALAGETPQARATSDLLFALGLEEMICDNPAKLSGELVKLSKDAGEADRLRGLISEALSERSSVEEVMKRGRALLGALAEFRKNKLAAESGA